MTKATVDLIRVGLTSGLLVIAAFGANVSAQDPNLAAQETVQRFRMNPYHVNLGEISSVAANGTVQVMGISNPKFALNRRVAGQVDLTEGYYLGLVASEFVVSTEDTRLVRVQVVKVGPNGSATVHVAPAAALKIRRAEQILFFRPPGSTTDELRAAPDFAAVEDGTETSVLGKESINLAGRLLSSKNNLKQIALAMHNYHDTYKRFPPAVVYGPDGKPWHSWRVLILPFVEQQPLYERYRFDEPWDGPNNRKLLSQMPAVYRDPIYGETGDYYTHYAVVSGEGTVFPANGSQIDEKNVKPRLLALRQPNRGSSRFAEILDGTANTLMAGSISPERKIPWMKPEDVVVGKEVARLGADDSFATPYQVAGVPAGVFALCDGSVRTIRDDIEPNMWRNLQMRADGNPIGDIPSGTTRGRRPGIRQTQMIEIIRTADGVRARLVSQPND